DLVLWPPGDEEWRLHARRNELVHLLAIPARANVLQAERCLPLLAQDDAAEEGAALALAIDDVRDAAKVDRDMVRARAALAHQQLPDVHDSNRRRLLARLHLSPDVRIGSWR